MIDVVIVGTIGLDTVETPFGKVTDALGGSGVYAALAASYFALPGLVSVAGRDLPKPHRTTMQHYGIDLGGVVQAGKTFRWSGVYTYDMNEAKTRATELNSLADFNPKLPASYQSPRYVFLGNFDPDLQLSVLDQIDRRAFVLLDTMNYWIASKRQSLIRAIGKATALVINEGEARQLCDTPNLIKAARMMLDMGPQFVIIKKGEHGALLFTYNSHFSAPGYPLEEVCDPTGAGDSFAGGLIGYLASRKERDEAAVRRGIIYGSAMASSCAEHFSVEYRKKVSKQELQERYDTFKRISQF